MHSVQQDFGEGPLGTKLHKSATTIKYPRPTRVKNKTSAPTQASTFFPPPLQPVELESFFFDTPFFGAPLPG